MSGTQLSAALFAMRMPKPAPAGARQYLNCSQIESGIGDGVMRMRGSGLVDALPNSWKSR
eukprot:scaffold117006_cov71-Phaeocystis_antarctica.AAC.3